MQYTQASRHIHIRNCEGAEYLEGACEEIYTCGRPKKEKLSTTTF
jgi:hypothetical protein